MDVILDDTVKMMTFKKKIFLFTFSHSFWVTNLVPCFVCVPFKSPTQNKNQFPLPASISGISPDTGFAGWSCTHAHHGPFPHHLIMPRHISILIPSFNSWNVPSHIYLVRNLPVHGCVHNTSKCTFTPKPLWSELNEIKFLWEHKFSSPALLPFLYLCCLSTQLWF